MTSTCSSSSNGVGKSEIWRLSVKGLHERLKSQSTSSTFEGNRQETLFHGLKMTSSTALLGKFVNVCFCSDTQEYLILDPGIMVQRYSMRGKPIQPPYTLNLTISFTKMIWVAELKIFIGYTPQEDVFWIATPTFVLYQSVRNEFKIQNLFYEPTSNEIIVVGLNKVTRFPVHNKEQALQSHKTVTYIDTEFGPVWNFECSSLIPQSTSLLRLAASYLTTIYVTPLEPDRDNDDGTPIPFLARRSAASDAPITAIHFLDTSEWIITGDQKGNIIGWNIHLECLMSSEGHRDKVKQIVPHPSICGFVTCSDDHVLQVWSCNLRDKVETFTEIEVWSMTINKTAAAIATLGNKFNCFRMQQVYIFYAPLTGAAKNLQSKISPVYPIRLVVTSADNTVRILSSEGKQLTVQVLPSTLDVISVAYSECLNQIYTILKTGEILISDSTNNPISFKYVWVSDGPSITCIAAYEYCKEKEEIDVKLKKTLMLDDVCVCIIVGTEEGNLQIIEHTTGKHKSAISAHDGSVIKLQCSDISSYLVSVGAEKCVKVWKIYPDISMPLILTYTVNNIMPITNVALMGSILCTVSFSKQLSMHPLFMYDMLNRNRLEHHSSKDHLKLVEDIATLESLQICASSSRDNTIRVWDKQNDLVTILEINMCGQSITFSSLHGDIVFGAGRHLYKIPHENYLSANYRARVSQNEIIKDAEHPIPENENYRVYETDIDRQLVLHPVSSCPLGALDIHDADITSLDSIMTEQVCSQLRTRDEDMKEIEDGKLETDKTIEKKALMNKDAWESYVSELLDDSDIKKIEVPFYSIGTIAEKYSGIRKTCNQAEIFRMLYAINYEPISNHPDCTLEVLKHCRIPLFGFLPNSAMYKIHQKMNHKIKQKNEEAEIFRLKYQYPPEFWRLKKYNERSIHKVPFRFSQLANPDVQTDVDFTVT